MDRGSETQIQNTVIFLFWIYLLFNFNISDFLLKHTCGDLVQGQK